MNASQKKKSVLGRIFKWTGISLLLLLVVIIILPFMFKDKIIQTIKEETNKQLNAKVDFKDFDLSLISSFPYFHFTINELSVVGVNEFEGDTLVGIRQLALDVNLMSVIKGDQYEIRKIALLQPHIYAQVLSNGKANWDIAKSGSDTTAAAPEDTSATKFKMSLKKLEITDAIIAYDDAQGNMNARLDDFDFLLSGDFTQDNFLLNIVSEIKKLNFKMDGIAYAKDILTKIKMDLDADMPNMKFTFKENEFDFNNLGLGLDGYFAMPGNDMNMDLKFLCKQTDFKSILSLIPAVYAKDFASVQTAGKLALNGYAKGTYNDKTMPAFGTHLEISDAMFKYPALPKSVNNIQVNLDVNNPNGNPDATVIDLNKFHVEMAGNPVNMVMHVKTPVSDPNLNGEVNGKIVLASMKEFIPLEKGDEMSGTITMDVKMNGKKSMIDKGHYEEFKAAGTVEVDKMNYKTTSLPYTVLLNTVKLSFSPQFVELNALDAKMGQSDITANGKIENFMQYIFQDSLIKGSFNMNSAYMNLNELMGPSSGTDSAGKPAAAADTTPMSIIEVPKNIDFVLNSSIKKLIYDKLEIDQVAGNIIVRNARVSMNNLKMNLLDGNMLMSGYYDTKNTRKPDIHFDLNINEFDIQKTFNAFNTVQKLAPVGKYAKGKFTATLNNLVGSLNPKMEPDLNTLSGGGVLKTKAVTVEGFEPFAKLGDALKNDNLKKMDFSDVNLKYAFKDGRIHVEPFKTKIKTILTEIVGSSGFDQSIDYKWDMEMPTKNLGSAANGAIQGLLSQANSKGANLSMGDKIKVTALIGGTVTKPEIKLGMKEALGNAKDQVKALVEEKKQEVINTVKDKASEEAAKLLAQAQQEADRLKAEAAKLAELAKTEGYKAADDLENSASNPIAKIAAKKGAEKLRKEADAKADKINQEANEKANRILEEARAKADKLK